MDESEIKQKYYSEFVDEGYGKLVTNLDEAFEFIKSCLVPNLEGNEGQVINLKSSSILEHGTMLKVRVRVEIMTIHELCHNPECAHNGECHGHEDECEEHFTETHKES